MANQERTVLDEGIDAVGEGLQRSGGRGVHVRQREFRVPLEIERAHEDICVQPAFANEA